MDLDLEPVGVDGHGGLELVEQRASFLAGGGVPEVFDADAVEQGDHGLEPLGEVVGSELVGGDLVEVSPPFDPSGNTALIGANFLYEMLCVLPGVAYGA